MIAALLMLVTLVWFAAGNSYADMPTGRARGMSEMLLYASIAVGWGRPILMTVLGTTLLWIRRWLPALLLLTLGASEMPPIRALTTGGVLYGGEWPLLLLGSHEFSPGLVGGTGWALLGVYTFFTNRRLERKRLDERRRALAEENRRKALRLYEEAFDAGDLGPVDELLAPGFLDRRRERRGLEEFKRAIADLRRSFPGLSLSVEDQRAEGDTVTTRCVLSGTDRGGVLWYPPTGRRATFSGTYVDRFSSGTLVAHGGESDKASLLKQLGFPADGE